MSFYNNLNKMSRTCERVDWSNLLISKKAYCPANKMNCTYKKVLEIAYISKSYTTTKNTFDWQLTYRVALAVVQKFYTHDTSLPRSGYVVILIGWSKFTATQLYLKDLIHFHDVHWSSMLTSENKFLFI